LTNTVSEFCAYFHCACAETAIQELPVKNLTPPFTPATSISYKTDVFPLPSDVYGINSMFLCYYVAWLCDLELWPFDPEIDWLGLNGTFSTVRPYRAL